MTSIVRATVARMSHNPQYRLHPHSKTSQSRTRWWAIARPLLGTLPNIMQQEGALEAESKRRRPLGSRRTWVATLGPSHSRQSKLEDRDWTKRDRRHVMTRSDGRREQGEGARGGGAAHFGYEHRWHWVDKAAGKSFFSVRKCIRPRPRRKGAVRSAAGVDTGPELPSVAEGATGARRPAARLPF